MDRFRTFRVLPLALALIMVLGTFTFSFANTDTEEGVQNEQEMNDADQSEVEDNTDEQADQATEISEQVEAPASLASQGAKAAGTTTMGATSTKAGSTLGKMTKVYLSPGYKSITLRWKRVKGAKYYYIRKKAPGKKIVTGRISATDKKYIKGSYMEWTDKYAGVGNALYQYAVCATDKLKSEKTVKKTAEYKVKGKCVRQMYQTIWLKYSVTLQSHGGGSGSRTFSSNQAIVTTGFGGGKYKFWYGGKYYYCNSTRVRKAKCDYTKKYNYSTRTAENYVNALHKAGEVRKSSKPKYLIWVSTYTQHLYVLKWDKTAKKWKLHKHFECATGKAGTPTRIDTKMTIERKAKWDGGIQWWNYFSTGNAIHGKRPSYTVDGDPHSSGCVRNYDYNAKWIWYNCPVGTPVAIY